MDRVTPPKSILITKTSALGDVVQTYPVIEYIKNHFPDCEIDWIVEKSAATLVSRHPSIRHTFIADTKKWRKSPLSKETREEVSKFRSAVRKEHYSLSLNLQGNLKSSLLTLSARASTKLGYGFRSAPETLGSLFLNQRYNPPRNLNIRNEYLSFVEELFQLPPPDSNISVTLKLTDQEEKELSLLELKEDSILVCPFSFWGNKEVSIETLFHLLLHIGKEGRTIYLLSGNDKEARITESLSRRLAGIAIPLPILSLPQLSHVMKKLGRVIACDSLPLHLAEVSGAKTLSFFGASSSKKYAPTGHNHLQIMGSCPYGETFVKRCKKLRTCKTGACIKNLPLQTVVNFYTKWIQN